MTEKIGLIKNPLTIIAIFAGIAEVSGTIVLPFIASQNQQLFIYFLIGFPSLLVLLFFITLNYNNKVLYAPSDYKDESNYISINRYDVSKQKTVELKVLKEDASSDQIVQLTEKISYLNSQVTRLEGLIFNKEATTPSEEAFMETIGYEFKVSNFKTAEVFVRQMKKDGIDFEIYHSPSNPEYSAYPEHRAIWLGTDVPLELAKFVIRKAKKYYPHLKYIKLSEEGDPDFNMLYIGGSTETAVKRYKRLPLNDTDFAKLESFTELATFHEFVEKFGR